MTFDIDFSEPAPEPVFLDTAAMIAQLERETYEYQSHMSELEASVREAMQKIQDKYAKDRADLIRKQNERIAQLKALRDAKEKEDAAKVFERTAAIVREIVKDFAAWSHAHEYQMEDIIQSVHGYLQGDKGILNANDMGMGKTFETIVTLYILTELWEQEHGSKPNVLWLTKASILETNSTNKEFKRWWPELKLASISGSMNKEHREYMVETMTELGVWIITNYESCKTTDAIKNETWDFIVMDEVHKLKGGANVSGPTAVWKATTELCKKSRFNIMLSGTPLVNRGDEMWSYLHVFDPVVFPDAANFRRLYSDYTGAGFHMGSVERLLKQALKHRMIRRSAKEVGLQLPELNQIDVELKHNPEQEKAYNQMRDNFYVWLDEAEGEGKLLTAAAIIAQLTRLLQINVWPVVEFDIKDMDGNVIGRDRIDIRDSSKLDEAEEIIEKAGEEQVVVFSRFNEPMRELKRRMDAKGISCEIINSDTKFKMGNYEGDFQQGKLRVLCINSAMGEGLNLQKSPDKWPGGAKFGITLDRWWNSARNDQCIARIYRQGASEPVFFYHLYVEESIDYFVLSLIEEKDKQFAQVMNSSEIRPASEWKQYLKGMI